MTFPSDRRLGDVCRVIGGGTPPKSRRDFYEGQIPWATVGDMQSDELRATALRITEDAVRQSASNVVPAGNVVIATRVGLGKVCILAQDTAINQDLRGIVPLEPAELSERYLFWWFRSVADRIVAEGTGATVQGVKAPFIRNLRIPVPDASSQRRTIARLDEASKLISVAKASTERSRQRARSACQAQTETAFAACDRGWIERPLGEIAAFRNGVNFTKTSQGETVRIVGVKDFRDNFWAPLDNLDAVTVSGALSEADTLAENDLLFVRSNGNVNLIGRTLLVGVLAAKTTHSGFTIRARLADDSVLPRYLCHYLKSPKARRQMIAGGTGTNIKSLSQGILSTLVVPIPPQADQARIVQEVEAVSAGTRSLERLYERKLAALDELEKSLLYWAFSGEL